MANEPVSDNLLVLMVLKGWPVEYKAFSAIFSQRDEKDNKMKFQEFKTTLRSYELMEESCTPSKTGVESIMNC